MGGTSAATLKVAWIYPSQPLAQPEMGAGVTTYHAGTNSNTLIPHCGGPHRAQIVSFIRSPWFLELGTAFTNVDEHARQEIGLQQDLSMDATDSEKTSE